VVEVIHSIIPELREVVSCHRSINRWALVLFLPVLLVFCVSHASGQATQQRLPSISADKKSPDDNTPLTTFEEEIRAKRLIKLAEKEHEENLKRAREISQIGQDLKAGLANSTATVKPDPKKVDRLEKLTKKIRGEAGGEDDDVQILQPPPDLPAAVNQIAETADQLSKDVQKTPRQVVSAAVIDRANVLLELVKILRGFIR
jgi:hypothetical protein